MSGVFGYYGKVGRGGREGGSRNSRRIEIIVQEGRTDTEEGIRFQYASKAAGTPSTRGLPL
jgi:hypothetical protein